MSTPDFIQGPDGQMRGRVAAGRDTVPTPTTTNPAANPADASAAGAPTSLADLLARLSALPGVSVDDAWEDQLDVQGFMHLADPRRAADEGRYGPGAGRDHMTSDGRCRRCDSRYCHAGCHAGEPGFVYAVGVGHVTFEQADVLEEQWLAAGLVPGVDFGPEHGTRRIEWRPGHGSAIYDRRVA